MPKPKRTTTEVETTQESKRKATDNDNEGAAKIAAGKMNPDLQKPMRTLKGLTEEDFTIVFPDTEKWTDNGVVDSKGIKKIVKQYEEDLKKMFDIMHGQLSSGITEKLKAKEDWTAAEEQAGILKLLKYLKEICY
eukprot:jgi/Psemu1/25199/gm1.25199_g